jgi:hypothetical protein
MRAPIFYDQNNTGFYVDAASTSVLNRISTVRTDNWLYIDNNYGHSVVGVYASTRYQGVFSMGDAYKLPADGTTTGNLYGIAWSHPNAGGVAGNLNTHGALLLENGGYLCALSGSIRCRDDMRTPIYYDANDTGYYVDPNGTSRLANRLYLHNWIEFVNYHGLYSPNNGAHFYPNDASYGSWRVAGSRNGWSGLEFDASNGQQSMMVSTGGTTIGWHNNSYGWKFQWEGGRMYCWDSTYGGGPQRMLLMQDTWQGSKHFSSDGAIYGTILYDANNSGYYCDPNGTSNLNSVSMQGGNVYGAMYFHANRNTTSDSPPLQAYSTNGSGAIMSFHRSGAYAVNFGLDSDNVMRIGGWSAASNRWQLDMSGNMTVAGNVTAYSDIRVKENIRTIGDALNKVISIRGVYFTRNDQEDKIKVHTGVIAQEVETVLPEVVSEDNEGKKNVAYGNMVGLLIEAIKEQQLQITELRGLIAHN